MKDDAHVDQADAQAKAPEPIIVKKYANRRLYNTATSSYVTLENLSSMVREGQDFVVLDARTGEDITRSVLTQIIFEEETKGDAMLPTSFLRQLIRLYGDTLQSYVPGYLEMTMKAFEHNQEAFRSQLERSFGHSPGFRQFDAMTRANMDMFRKAMGVFAPFPQADADGQPGSLRTDDGGDPATPTANREASASELESLRQELEKMQRRIDRIAKS